MADQFPAGSEVTHRQGGASGAGYWASSSWFVVLLAYGRGAACVAASVASMRLPGSQVGAVLVACASLGLPLPCPWGPACGGVTGNAPGALGKRAPPLRRGCHLPVSVSDAENIRASLYGHAPQSPLTAPGWPRFFAVALCLKRRGTPWPVAVTTFTVEGFGSDGACAVSGRSHLPMGRVPPSPNPTPHLLRATPTSRCRRQDAGQRCRRLAGEVPALCRPACRHAPHRQAQALRRKRRPSG